MRLAALSRVIILAGLFTALPPDRPTALFAQCPDGTPPPCRGARAAPRYDYSTALVVPLNPVGGDPTLRALGVDFAAIVAQNITAGDVHGVQAADLAATPAAARTRAALRQGAGAVIDGTVLAIGSRVRATVRLLRTDSSTVITTGTVEGTRDSLLAMADRASILLLRGWWGAQRLPRLHAGASTTSLPALRHYVNAMGVWGRGGNWRVLLDSAVRYDPDFLAAWLWLALPAIDEPTMDLGGVGSIMAAMSAGLGVITPDSASRALVAVIDRQTPASRRETIALPNIIFVAPLAHAAVPPPVVGFERMFGCESNVNPAVEAAYVYAVGARLATVAGCPDSSALTAARMAAQLDSSFVPAQRLLIEELIDGGDTAAARRLLDRHPGINRDWENAQRELLRYRLAPLVVDTSDALQLLPKWHRYRDLLDALPAFRSLMAAAPGNRTLVGLGSVIGLMFEAPAYYALGMRDSAAATLRSSMDGMTRGIRGSAGAATGPQAWLMWGNMPVPAPDSLMYPAALDTTQLLANMHQLSMPLPGAAARADVAGLQRRMMNTLMVRMLWTHGVFAIERGDLPSARRIAAALDSLVVNDSVGTRAMALGLRAELALAADSGDVAVGLLTTALSVSATAVPSRYRWLLARQYASTGHPELALRLAHAITMPSALHGSDNAGYFASALKLEAEMLERLGRRTEAVARLGEYIELRRNADAAFQPDVADARARLARVTAP